MSLELPEISDAMMRQALPTSRACTVVILSTGPHPERDDAEAIVWEHGRRNFAPRAAGLLAVVCPVPDGSPVHGVGIFNAEPEQVEQIMAEDPGVQAGLFSSEVHAARGFPGDCLPPAD